MKVGTKRVPASGDPHAKIMIVGEAPGEHEELQGLPFVGPSGEILWRYMNELGVTREECWVTNVCKYRPAGNKFDNLFIEKGKPSDELAEGIEELKAEIMFVKPHVIATMGGWPLWYVTGKAGEKNGKPVPGTGSMSYRGSILPSTFQRTPFIYFKVVACIHPAVLTRNWKIHPTLKLDLRRVVEESHTSSIVYPTHETVVDPTWDLVRELAQAEWLSVDIETFRDKKKGSQLACVGFSDSPSRGVCITQDRDQMKYLLTCPAKKCLQFGQDFDIPYLWYHEGWEVTNYSWDTFVAAATLQPEWPRSLAFLCSIYTRYPFYKEERKTWVRKGLDALWQYNARDVVVTSCIRPQQEKELNPWPVKVRYGQ